MIQFLVDFVDEYSVYVNLAFIFLLLFTGLFLYLRVRRKHKRDLTVKIFGKSGFLTSFADADENLVYLKNENLKIILVNKTFEDYYNVTLDDVLGKDDFAVNDKEFAFIKRELDNKVLTEKKVINRQITYKGRVYKIVKFPVVMLNKKLGVGTFERDITEEVEMVRRKEKENYRLKALSEVFTQSFESRQKQLDYVLHKALELTESQYGYIFFYDEEKKEFTLNSWTKSVLEDCAVENAENVYTLDEARLWGDVVRSRKAVIINDFDKMFASGGRYPKGHVEIKRFMSIPVMLDGKIVAAVGFANKAEDYDDNDLFEINLLFHNAWNAVIRREAEEKLIFQRNKYLQTLVSIGDGILIVDRDGKVEMINSVAEKLTGYKNSEAAGLHYKEIFKLSHEQSSFKISDPISEVFRTNEVQILENHTVLTSKTGERWNIEDSAAPIKNEKGDTTGAVLVFRDVTEKKEQRRKIEYLSFHDALTGLYNRRYLQERLLYLDNESNYPLSIIIGDVNGLKLTNDVFGHTSGDALLERVASVFKRVCGEKSIIARTSGDEFVLLLPKTTSTEAESVIYKIKDEFSKEKVRTIRGSISMGATVKTDASKSIWDVFDEAEEAMYNSKIIDREKFKCSTINEIMETLHEICPKEKEHSEIVSELCYRMGLELGLDSTELKKFRDAGYYHDIGKIALEPCLIRRNFGINDKEYNQIKKHPIVGFRILDLFEKTVDIAEPVLAHQERWDGTGYPKGLKGEEIPILSRVIAICESFARRCAGAENRSPMSKEEAIQSLLTNKGKHFEPELTDIFVNMIKRELN